MQMWNSLQQRELRGDPIRVGLVGVGQMGEGLICQCERIPGMAVVAATSRRSESCTAAWQAGGVPLSGLSKTDDPLHADELVSQGQRVAVASAAALCAMHNIDVVVEATGSPASGAEVALLAIQAGKHVVQMNVEADATVGYRLRQLARRRGVIYSLSGGDEPGALAQMVDFAMSLALEVVCAGKGKNNPVNRYARSVDAPIVAKAGKYRMSPKMLTSFVDGSKTMVEMTSLGNAIGFRPDVPGMHGPQVSPADLAKVFAPREAGGILQRTQVVEYGLGVAPGVFVIVKVNHPKVLLDFQYLAMGEGPYYALYRPYHLVSLETPISLFTVVERGETVLACDSPPVNEATARAKRELAAGTLLSELGGDDYYGMIETRARAQAEQMLPLGLAPGARLLRPLKRDQPVRLCEVELDEEQPITRLFRQQKQQLAAADGAKDQGGVDEPRTKAAATTA